MQYKGTCVYYWALGWFCASALGLCAQPHGLSTEKVTLSLQYALLDTSIYMLLAPIERLHTRGQIHVDSWSLCPKIFLRTRRPCSLTKPRRRQQPRRRYFETRRQTERPRPRPESAPGASHFQHVAARGAGHPQCLPTDVRSLASHPVTKTTRGTLRRAGAEAASSSDMPADRSEGLCDRASVNTSCSRR